ncbi:MAG: citrate synthase [Parachlamydiaceae bacterium]|nr:citrate synthase [Parachlamydiaceae bacterium]
MSEVLFEITKASLETGMHGFPVGYCTTSRIDSHKGLYYSDLSVTEFASWEPEQVIYLLDFGREGSKSEVFAFSQELYNRGKCSDKTLEFIHRLPRFGSPMRMLSTALLIAGLFEGKNDYWEDYLDLIAKIPEIVATVINYHAGWIGNRSSNPKLGYIENFVHLLNAPNLDRPQLIRALKLFNIFHYDYGGGELSTFVGKVVASGMEEMYGSISASMCALAGSRHGRSTQDGLGFVAEVLQELGPDTTLKKVEIFLRQRIIHEQNILGFGQAALLVEDPRATVLYRVAEEMYPADPLCRIANLLRIAVPNVLKEDPKNINPFANVEAISGALISAAGFAYSDYFALLFGMSRIVGIARQIVYERCEARGGMGTPIVHPEYVFKSRREKVQ